MAAITTPYIQTVTSFNEFPDPEPLGDGEVGFLFLDVDDTLCELPSPVSTPLYEFCSTMHHDRTGEWKTPHFDFLSHLRAHPDVKAVAPEDPALINAKIEAYAKAGWTVKILTSRSPNDDVKTGNDLAQAGIKGVPTSIDAAIYKMIDAEGKPKRGSDGRSFNKGQTLELVHPEFFDGTTRVRARFIDNDKRHPTDVAAVAEKADKLAMECFHYVPQPSLPEGVYLSDQQMEEALVGFHLYDTQGTLKPPQVTPEAVDEAKKHFNITKLDNDTLFDEVIRKIAIKIGRPFGVDKKSE